MTDPRYIAQVALAKAARLTIENMAFLEAKPCDSASLRRSGEKVCWSWVKVIEPCSGMLALLLPIELGWSIAKSMTGMTRDQLNHTDVLDAQAEITNIIAGRLVNLLFGEASILSLGIPRTGRGAPDVRHGDWLGQVFQIGDWWMATFINGDGIINPSVRLAKTTVRVHATGDAAIVTDILRPPSSSTSNRIAGTDILRPPSASSDQAASDACDEQPTVAISADADRSHQGSMRVVSMAQFARDYPSDASSSGEHPATKSSKSGSSRRFSPSQAPAASESSVQPKVGKHGTIAIDKDQEATADHLDSVALAWAKAAKRRERVELNVPESFGNYRILAKIGEGGMGVVFKAQQLTLDRLVALKVMKPPPGEDALATQRFLREARLAAAVDHPNVVNVYDAGSEAGFLYIALRYVAGGDLASLLAQHGSLPEAKALPFFRACVCGLQAIDDRGMVHRDIKPANILLERDWTPRLADLGLARTVEVDDGLSRIGLPMGTPSFMSPEQVRASPNLDVRSDLYSLGVTMYTAVTCVVPFIGKSIYDTVAKVLYSQVVDPRERNGDLSEALTRIILKAMHKEPSARYQKPVDLLTDLDALMQQRGIRPTIPESGIFLAKSATTAIATEAHSAADDHTNSWSGTTWLRKMFQRRKRGAKP